MTRLTNRLLSSLVTQWEIKFRANPYDIIDPALFGQANGIVDADTLSAFIDACLTARNRITAEIVAMGLEAPDAYPALMEEPTALDDLDDDQEHGGEG